ncbi:MAG: hypothetical protein ACFB13_12645 [Kiloniellaceae bacterium]
MKTFVDIYGIAVEPEEIHRVAEEINGILRARGDEPMERFNNGMRGGYFYKNDFPDDPQLDLSYNFVQLFRQREVSWEEEDFKELTIILDASTEDLSLLDDLEQPLLALGFVKVRRRWFDRSTDERGTLFELTPKGAPK